MKLESIYHHIQTHKGEHIEKVREFLRQPSISAENIGVRESADMLLRYYHKLGCQEVELVETEGHPGVWAYLDSGAQKTIVNYCMYDVQPVAEQPWTHDPFAADLIPQPPFRLVVIARGAYNSKGPYRMWLNALESIIAVEGHLPVNIMFVAEGEEEIGSPHLAQIVNRYRERLAQADAVLNLHASQDIHGKARMVLGNKGIVYLELRCTGKRWGRGPQSRWLHSSRKAVVDSPVWRLIHALSTLTTPDGNKIAISGIYDNVVPPTPEDEYLIHQLVETFDETAWKEEWDVLRFVDDIGGEELLRQYYFAPSLNIDGIWAGYIGPGTLTVIPHEATCQLDFRLVPNMHSEEIVPKLRAHLDHHGYTDIEIRVKAAYEWSKTHPNAKVVQAVQRVYEQYGIDFDVWPLSAGSAPMHLFTRAPLNLTLAEGGLGHGGRNHAHDEYLVIEGNNKVAGLVEAEKSYVDILFAYASMNE